ncbi:MAG: S-layer homology domain-containing protein [Acidobacteria bacterium]|nr:S-layer homology domain-containing protein [Acidobacteriota bacterium]
MKVTMGISTSRRRFAALLAGATLVALLVLPGGTGVANAAPTDPGGSFTDDDGSVHEGSIEAISAKAITLGCNPPANTRFCPESPITRGQMAAFLTRALDLPAGLANQFVDVGESPFVADIAALATAGITKGCNPPKSDRFCPGASVTRGEMATFLTRALGLTAVTPPQRCSILPADNIWNTRIDTAPLDPRSDDYISSIGVTGFIRADFGSGVWPPGSDSPIGIPLIEVDDAQPDVAINWTAYGDESDDGPYPIPGDAPIEGGASSNGDGSWNADSGAVYYLRSNDLRPNGWTSADAAGLPITPGLVTYDEVASGRIEHAIRFTVSTSQRAYVWPARHFASSNTSASVPPMGQRFRLKASFDISGYALEIQVIMTAFKEYGIIVADNGADWMVSGVLDSRWDNDMLRELRDIPGSAFEAVDVSSWMVDPDSGQVSP